jgi:hypothetical protein
MARFAAWKLTDPLTSSTYDFPVNPNEMTSPFPERNITAHGTTSPNGQPLFFEGARTPVQWSFSGNCPTAAQYEALRAWVYDRTGRRVILVDHFGRQLVCILRNFDAKPRRDKNRYWHHTYQITAHVISVGAPTIGEVWR